MAATNFTPISLYYSTTASAVPTAANLVPGELAINTNDGKLYYEDSSGVVQVLATKSTGSIGGSNTQVQFNNSGSLGGSSSFTWDGTTVTATKFAGALNGTVGATTASTGAFTTLSATGVTTFSAGTVSLPAITTTGDTNTGIFFPAADTIAFTEGGAESMRIDSSGNLLVGTTSAVGKLTIDAPNTLVSPTISMRNAGGLYGFDFDSENVSVGRLDLYAVTNGVRSQVISFMRSSGNVGIGTSSPSSYSIYGNKLVVYGTGTNGPGITIATGTADTGTLFFADGTTGTETYRGSVGYSHGDDALLFGTSATERMRIDSSGNLLVGKTAYVSVSTDGLYLGKTYNQWSLTSDSTYVNRNGTDGAVFNFYKAGTAVGSIDVTTLLTTYNTTSDYRLKDNIAPMTGALAKVSQLKPVTYKWKSDGSNGEGFIAHELAEVIPQAVTGQKDAVEEDGTPHYQGIDTSFLVATLTKAIQEQQALIESLTTRLIALENK
jgi:hypothetical protein